MRFFDPDDDIEITERRLPHWAQVGTVCFITWRTKDSMPKAVVDSWITDRNDWLRIHGIDSSKVGWKSKLYAMSPALISEFHQRFTTRWPNELDACHGESVLRDRQLSQIVSDSLMHFHGDRYDMHAYVVMPNHVHLLASFPDKEGMLRQCQSWKHYTAIEIKKRIGSKGRFWQQDSFDHLVRHEAQFERLKVYIEENPIKAKLKPGEYIHRVLK